MTYNPHTNGRAMYHDYGEVPDAREQEAMREACTCRWGYSFIHPVETCPLHTPPEPEGV